MISTQLVLVATFVPQHDEGSNSFSFIEVHFYSVLVCVGITAIWSHSTPDRDNKTQELLFLLFSIVDVVGMYYSLNYLKRSNTAKHLKILTAAIGILFSLTISISIPKSEFHLNICDNVGWGFAEALLGKFMPLWFDTRGVEFHWENVIMGLDANIRLVRQCLRPHTPTVI